MEKLVVGDERKSNIPIEDEWKSQIPTGVYFRPTDFELIIYYLFIKVFGGIIFPGIILDLDIYKFEPFELKQMAFNHGDQKLYFFTRRQKNRPKGMSRRSTPLGYWKATREKVIIRDEYGKEIGSKKFFYYQQLIPSINDYENENFKWIMVEYKLSEQMSPPMDYQEGSKLYGQLADLGSDGLL
ncbi:hypothetical protein HHK36_025971 [Tetracentron sinense]|uniref:NAC domain-containing protein n=1 Tax=Tetracentron sinense TaxID=13715 RepID=A0A835D3M8_TETSI|nr:hypothetical protein HHK36_025971 [Tetracentron sinense]